MSSATVSSAMRRAKLLLLLVAVTVWKVATPTAAEGGPFFRWAFKAVRFGGGMDFGGGVEGGLKVLGCLGDEGVDREGPGWGVDFLCRSSRFLNSISCSNFSRPGLKDLTKGGVDCLGGVLGGNFLLLGGDLDSCAYDLEVGELLVPTWV